MLDLLLGALALGDVDGRALDHREGPSGPSMRFSLSRTQTSAAVLALQAELVVGQALALEELGQGGLAVFGVQIEVPGRLLEDLLPRGVAEDPGEGLVAVEDPAVERRAVDAGEVALEERAVALLRQPQRLFDLAPAADVGDRAEAALALAVRAAQERARVVPVERRAVLAHDPVLLEERLARLEVPGGAREDPRAVLRMDGLLPALDVARELAARRSRGCGRCPRTRDLAGLRGRIRG